MFAMPLRLFVAAMTLGAVSSPILAQSEQAPRPSDPIAFEGFQFRQVGAARTAEIAEHLGRPSLRISNATVMADDVELADSVIEFDIAFKDERGFNGVLWRAADAENAEYFYLRQHKSGDPDAGQYAPLRGGITSWQIYSDANGIGPFAFTHEGWNRVRIVSIGDRAEIFLNGASMPTLHIGDLATDRASGTFGFRSSGPRGEAYLSNIVARPLEPGERLVSAPADVEPPPTGVIERWAVTGPIAESDVAGRLMLPAKPSNAAPQLLTVEPTGIADISRVAELSGDMNTVLVSATLTAGEAKRVAMSFGYSDRVHLFLNGELIFSGVAGFRSRDYFFLGTVGFFDRVALPLKAGENVLTAAVSETFGGWAWAAALEDADGIEVGVPD